MSMAAVRGSIIAEQASRKKAGKSYRKYRLGNYPGYPNIGIIKYLSPTGNGFHIIETRIHNSKTQIKIESYGPESRSKDWVNIIESNPIS